MADYDTTALGSRHWPAWPCRRTATHSGDAAISADKLRIDGFIEMALALDDLWSLENETREQARLGGWLAMPA